MELISRQAAIDALEKWLHGLFGITEADGTATIFKTIRQLPPIQPEIIRCKDCKYGILDHEFPHQYFCNFKGNEWNNDDYFCGHAERREATT